MSESEAAPIEGEYLPMASNYESDNLGGRPRLYDNPAQFDESVDAYWAFCKSNPGEPLTITGLCLFMGFSSVKTLANYATYEGFLPSVERAKLIISWGYEKRLSGANSAGAKFALSCIDGGAFWNDRKTVEVTGPERHEDRLARLK